MKRIFIVSILSFTVEIVAFASGSSGGINSSSTDTSSS